MNKILILLALTITLQLQAQDINAKLGGNTANETYDITDSSDSQQNLCLLLYVHL